MAPNPPTNLVVNWTRIGGRLYDILIWDYSSDAEMYNVYRGVDTNTPSLLIATLFLDATGFADFVVSGAHYYSYSVTAVNADGESAPSNVQVIHPGQP
jgi:fibronectin type 3 domain-containing protein